MLTYLSILLHDEKEMCVYQCSVSIYEERECSLIQKKTLRKKKSIYFAKWRRTEEGKKCVSPEKSACGCCYCWALFRRHTFFTNTAHCVYLSARLLFSYHREMCFFLDLSKLMLLVHDFFSPPPPSILSTTHQFSIEINFYNKLIYNNKSFLIACQLSINRNYS